MKGYNIQHGVAPPSRDQLFNPGHKFPRVETETLSVKLRAAQKRQLNASNRLIDVKPTLKQVCIRVVTNAELVVWALYDSDSVFSVRSAHGMAALFVKHSQARTASLAGHAGSPKPL